jgi:hypothetical protein
MVRRKTQRAGAKVRNETFMNALKRDYVFFYSKLKGIEPSKETRFLEPSQEEEVRRVLLNAKRKGMENDTIIQNIFHSDPIQFQRELSNWEDYAPEGVLNKGTNFERRPFQVAKSLDRFIGTIQSSPKILKYKSDFMVHICESSNFTEPVKSLSDTFCFTVLTPELKELYEENKGSGYAVSYIIVKPEFFPPRVTVSGGPINLNAQRIASISFLLDAFQQDGIIEMDPTFYGTLRREAPELLRFSIEQPVVLVAPESLSNASTTRDRFIVMSPTVLPRGRNVVNMRNFPTKPILKQAFETQSVYFMDPRTMYEIRSQFPALWEANYGTKDQAIFKTLTPYEQLVYCFLQFKRFEELYSISLTANSLANAKQALFTLGDPYELADNFTLEDEENLRQMIKLQQTVFKSVEIRTPDDIDALLRKFDPLATPKPVKRKEQPVYSAELLEQRKPLLQAYQNALRSPVSRSKLPSFLRTRKVKNANREDWKQRVRTAKAALLNFNKAHNLPFSKGAERYNL